MALSGPQSFHGVALPAAYLRVGGVQIRNKTQVSCQILTYASAAEAAPKTTQKQVTRPGGKVVERTVGEAPGALTSAPLEFTLDLASSQNVYQQAYAAAKADPRFAGLADA